MWQYRLFDYDPLLHPDEEQWAREVAAEGWRTWRPGPGPWITIGGRRVRRWSLRRPCDNPFRTEPQAATYAVPRASADRVERAERTRQVEEAAHSVRMAGLELSPEARVDADDYVAGRIGLEEYGRRTRSRYGLADDAS